MVLDNPVDKTVNNHANDDTEIVHYIENLLMNVLKWFLWEIDTTKHCGTKVLVNVLSLSIVAKASPQNAKLNYIPAG